MTSPRPDTLNQSTHPDYMLGKLAFDMGFDRDDYEDALAAEGEEDIVAKTAWQQGWDTAQAIRALTQGKPDHIGDKHG